MASYSRNGCVTAFYDEERRQQYAETGEKMARAQWEAWVAAHNSRNKGDSGK